VRRTRVRDRRNGRTYNLADALLAWPKYVRRDPRSLQTACELVANGVDLATGGRRVAPRTLNEPRRRISMTERSLVKRRSIAD
jgi:hypothetical protein